MAFGSESFGWAFGGSPLSGGLRDTNGDGILDLAHGRPGSYLALETHPYNTLAPTPSRTAASAADARWIDGTAGNDTINGGAGVDYILAHGGNDLVYAGLGNDGIDGLDGNDTLYGGAGNDRVAGWRGNDVLYGDAGDDLITGGGGDDTINGGLGSDTLVGHDGNNVYVFDTRLAKGEVDSITLFEVKTDTIWLDNKVFTKLGKGTPTKPVKLSKDAFWAGAKAEDKQDRIIYDKKTGYLYYDADGTGKAKQVHFATLDKAQRNLKVTHEDFFVI